jgi:hypothetical protein
MPKRRLFFELGRNRIMDEKVKTSGETASKPTPGENENSATELTMEQKKAADKSAQMTTILGVIESLALKNLRTAHMMWRTCTTRGLTPRPRREDDFRSLLFEMVHTGKLTLLSGDVITSPLTKISIKVSKPTDA